MKTLIITNVICYIHIYFLIRNIDLDITDIEIITSVIINISVTVLLPISIILFTFIIDQLHQFFIKPPHHAHYVCAAVTKTLKAPFLHVTHRQQHSCWFLLETAVWGICKVIYDFFHEKLSLEINHSILLSCKFFLPVKTGVDVWTKTSRFSSFAALSVGQVHMKGKSFLSILTQVRTVEWCNNIWHLRASFQPLFTILNHSTKNRVFSYHSAIVETSAAWLPLVLDVSYRYHLTVTLSEGPLYLQFMLGYG